MSDNQKTSTTILLMIISGLVGAFANQLFHDRNKKVDSKTELQKDLLKEQFTKLNRILNFAYRYTEVHIIYVTNYIDPDTGEEIQKEDSDNLKGVESVDLPSFVADKTYRNEFNTTLNEIVNEKNLVDHSIAVKIDQVMLYLRKHPFPINFEEDSLKSSEWSKKQIKDGWISVMHDLYIATSKVVNDL